MHQQIIMQGKARILAIGSTVARVGKSPDPFGFSSDLELFCAPGGNRVDLLSQHPPPRHQFRLIFSFSFYSVPYPYPFPLSLPLSQQHVPRRLRTLEYPTTFLSSRSQQ